MAPGCLLAYYCFMNNEKPLFIKAGQARLILCIAGLGLLTGCVGYVEGPGPERVYAEPSVVVVQDDYVYYPEYEVYYSRTRREYVYPEGGQWVSRPTPRGISVNVLVSSPSVAVDFHDSPAAHHAAVIRQYPRNWAPPAQNHDQRRDQKSPPSPPKDNRHDDKHDDRNDHKDNRHDDKAPPKDDSHVYQHDDKGDRRDDHPQK
jgi:hypothetical protein